MVKQKAKSYFESKKPYLEDGWAAQNHAERTRFMNKACSAWHERDCETWPSLSSFLLFDSASEYSFKIPAATFRKAYSRYIQILENKIASGDTSIGLLELIGLKSGRKAISDKAKKVVVDVAKGLKKV